ncbi:MAG: efflux RND transporter periplasmic adaptor subunit [Clostridia bacterium]|nr:efflux RND transporter periplasmic adaptor subunit [Clostridia bacterium]
MKTIGKWIKWLWAGKKKYVVVAAVVVGVMVAAMGMKGSGLELQGTVVDTGVVQSYVEEVGDFEAKQAITLNGRVSGVVETIHHVEGDTVKAGDVLIELDKGDQLLLIQSTEAEIDAIYAELAEAGRADSNRIAQIKSKIAVAQNASIESKEVYDDNGLLYESGAISKVDLDNSKRDYEDSLQSLRIAQNDLTLLTKGVSESVQKQYESRIQALNAQLELEKRQLNQMSIQAPMDGVVTDKFVEIGDAVSFGTPIVEVSNPSAFQVVSDLLVSDAAGVKVGYKVIITDPESDEEWLGKIAKIYPKAFTKVSDLGIEQKRIKVEIEPEAMAFEKYGYEFDLKIIFEEKEAVLRCKDSALFKIDGQDYVFKVVGGKATLAPVTIGLEGEEYVEIFEGLSEGDMLVQSPGNELAEGMKVKIK